MRPVGGQLGTVYGRRDCQAMNADEILIRCQKCGRWPMSVGAVTSLWRLREIKFVCVCGNEQKEVEKSLRGRLSQGLERY